MALLGIDFFCGCGGTTRGFLDSGIKVVKGIDSDGRCKETFEHNNSPAIFECNDVYAITSEHVLKNISLEPGDHLLLSGCAPCQPFSQQNRKRDNDGRRALLLQFGRFVEDIRPSFVFVENVPGIQRVTGNSAFRRFLKLLDDAGYEYDYDIVDAKDYGVPQSRARLILVASRLGPIRLPQKTHGTGASLLPYNTVGSAIKKYPPLLAGETHAWVPNHVASSISPRNLERLQYTPPDGGGRAHWPRHMWLECHKDQESHSDVYGRMFWDRPAPALTCRCTSISNGRYGHPDQDRAISVREAAALQTFPETFLFFGAKKNISSQIGNAVPVLIAKLFGKHFLSHLSGALD
ncbi:MAG: hypothetical protein JWR26_67 [Pedosphaera sp.]|nr:hypothetical protein [Pedosphaera sp.]